MGVDTGPTITSDVLRLSLQTKDQVTNMQAIPTSMVAGSAACVSGSQLYVTGVGKSIREAWKWESVVGWTRCADTNDIRNGHCATFVNITSMYVLGGFVDTDTEMKTLDSIEQYNTVTNKWTKVGQLTHAVWAAACAVYKTSIYVFGGNIQNDMDRDCVQVFDTATKVCTELTQRLPRPEALLRAVMWDKSVLLLNNRKCLIFDLEQKTFQPRHQFSAGIVHFCLVFENQRIFVIGGVNHQTDSAGNSTWTSSDEVKSVAVMDIINNQSTPNWIHHAKLPTPCLVQAFASMTLPT